ncbi:MAG: IS1182 family transposase [Chloroflexi bacterium]|nr:IS1182 family transposase [Chloroflexota bacterium]
MSMSRRYIVEIPEETKEIAQTAFPNGNMYMTMRDELGMMYEDSEFAQLFAHDGQPGLPPGLVAMVTVMQYAEGLTDRQAAEAVRARIDWKYALNLEIRDSGFHYSVLSEFRDRLIAGGQEAKLLDDMLQQWRERGLVKAGGQQRTDSTAVLARIRQLNRLSCVGETMRRVLNDMSVVAPEWLRQQISQDWFDRYGPRFDGYRIPQKKSEQEALRMAIGLDGWHLLSQIYQENAPPFLAAIPSVDILRCVWLQNYYLDEDQLKWRTDKNTPPKRLLIQSPYDHEARNGSKRDVNWTGYKVHLTESCEEESPHIIIHVDTRPAAVTDVEVIEDIHDALAQKQLLPGEHFVDAGYTSAIKLWQAREEYSLELVGPLLPNSSWQARAGVGYASACFSIDWEEQQATCPQGKVSARWEAARDKHGQERVHIRFSPEECIACASRTLCTKSATAPRTLSIYLQPIYETLQSARQRQETEAFKEKCHRRAGVEGTISQGTRSFGLRRARYVGLAKTHLQHVATAAAINLTRLVSWFHEIPKGKTRQSNFLALAASF